MPKRTYIIDGSTFGSLVEIAAVFTRVFELTSPWDGRLAMLPMLMRGGYGTPHDGFILVWKNAEASRGRLNHRALIHPLRDMVSDLPHQAAEIEEQIDDAKGRRGPTLFDTIVNILLKEGDIEVRLE